MNYLLSLLSALLFMNGGSERFWKHLSFKKYFNLIFVCAKHVWLFELLNSWYLLFFLSLFCDNSVFEVEPHAPAIFMLPTSDDSQWGQHFLKVLLIRIFIWSLPNSFSIKTFAAFYENKLSREITEAWQFFGRFER